MPLTVALSGMDAATETALRAAFAGASALLDAPCPLIAESESDAEYVIVDMDSMYGPMDWLRLHAEGKQIVALTSAPRAQTRFRLGRPFDGATVAALLRALVAAQDIAADARMSPPAPAAPGPPAAVATRVAATGPKPGPALPLASWIDAGVLRGRHRYRRAPGPTLWLDFDARQYHGPTTLKPLSPYFEGRIERDAIEAVDAATWSREAQTAGAPQPLRRLVWLGGLLAGNGTPAPAHGPEARYRLNTWPPTEREYPRQFRIAAAMMKGPATLEEIAAASGLPTEAVVRFVNANLATGDAEPLVETPATLDEPTRPRGFFGRLLRR